MTRDNTPITIYTDGSCNGKTGIGGWAAIIVAKGEKIVLQGTEFSTTHNRMELTAVIEAIKFSAINYPDLILNVYTDSQYVAVLPERKEKLVSKEFITKKGNALRNADLLQQLISFIDNYSIVFHKVKAHQKSTEAENINREVDIICRKIMREASD